MILKKNHFAAWQINWENKALHLARIAGELNLGLDSFVFIDDDAFQQNIIRSSFPEVAVISAGDYDALDRFLSGYAGFCNFNLTDEDAKRGQMYAEERSRKEFQGKFRNIDDFLRELNLRVSVEEAGKDLIPRVSQLTQKTNQFNLTTRRYSPEEITKFLNLGWKVWAVNVSDKFGDYGLTGVCMTDTTGERTWKIDNFLLSCRVLGRNVEKALLTHVFREAAKAGAKTILAEYIPTPKNAPCATFLQDSNFIASGPLEKPAYYEYKIVL